MSGIPLTSFKEKQEHDRSKVFECPFIYIDTAHGNIHIYSAVACWNLTLKLSTVICRNFLILKSVLNNQSPLDEGLCSHYITCKLKLWLPRAGSLKCRRTCFSFRQSFKGLSFRFWRAAAAVPGLCPSNAGSGSLREGLVPSCVDISLQTNRNISDSTSFLIGWFYRAHSCVLDLSFLSPEREMQHIYYRFLDRYSKKILSIYVFCGKKLVHSRSYWTRPGCGLKGDRGQKMFWSKFTPVVGLNTPRTTCSDLELDYKTNQFVNLLNSFLSCSLQNRRNFLRISGEQRRKRGEREAFLALLPSQATCASRSPRFRLCSPEMRQKLRLFCWLPFLLHYKYCFIKSIIIVHHRVVARCFFSQCEWI